MLKEEITMVNWAFLIKVNNFGIGSGYFYNSVDLDIVNIPSVITSLNDVKVRQIACGGGHTIALSGN